MKKITIGTEKQIAYATTKRNKEIEQIERKIEKGGHLKSIEKKIPEMKAYIELLKKMDNARDILAAIEMSYGLAVKKFDKYLK